MLLDRTYLEVRSANGTETDPGAAPRPSGWFLRPDEIEEAAAILRAQGIACTGPAPYAGFDGSWLDLTIDAGQAPGSRP